MLATSLAPELSGVEDGGVKGDAGDFDPSLLRLECPLDARSACTGLVFSVGGV